MLNNKTVLVTGGTGSFGQKFVEIALKKHKLKKLIVFSRDEYKQFLMRKRFTQDNIRFFLGDIRDSARLHRALHGVDIVVHAAALKHVPLLEHDPFEAVKTNIFGTENLINSAIDNRVKKVIALSSDKAVNPINLYGATKLCADKLFISGNAYSGDAKTIFSVVRYGNVFASRGSVVEIYKKEKGKGILPITDINMTRFWITLEQGVNFVLKCLNMMKGGEIFIPKLASMKLVDLAKAVAPGAKFKIIGIRPGEKLHEILLTADDARHTIEERDMYITIPDFAVVSETEKYYKKKERLKDRFVYASNTNTKWLTVKELQKMIGDSWE